MEGGTVKLPPSEDPGDLRAGYFFALWEIDKWFAFDEKLSLRNFNEQMYGCFCSMWLYYSFTPKLDDFPKILPHSLEDFFWVRDFWLPYDEPTATAMERICELTLGIPRHLWGAVGEGFRELWTNSHVDNRYSEALRVFYDLRDADMASGGTLLRHMEQFAMLHWPFEVVSEDEYRVWLIDQLKARPRQQ